MDRKILETAAGVLGAAYKELVANRSVSDGEADVLLTALSILNNAVYEWRVDSGRA